jgi:hypothetical protein
MTYADQLASQEVFDYGAAGVLMGALVDVVGSTDERAYNWLPQDTWEVLRDSVGRSERYLESHRVLDLELIPRDAEPRDYDFFVLRGMRDRVLQMAQDEASPRTHGTANGLEIGGVSVTAWDLNTAGARSDVDDVRGVTQAFGIGFAAVFLGIIETAPDNVDLDTLMWQAADQLVAAGGSLT